MQVIDTTQKFAGQSQERGALSLLMTATEPSLTGTRADMLPGFSHDRASNVVATMNGLLSQ